MVFETHDTAKMEIPSALGSPGEHAWGYVYQRLNMYWLHVVAVRMVDNDDHREQRIFFLIHPKDLQIIDVSPEWEIIEASIVTPPHMNKTDHWKMELLDQIIQGRESKLDHEQYGYVFVLNNGNRYTHSYSNSGTDLVDIKSVYQACS